MVLVNLDNVLKGVFSYCGRVCLVRLIFVNVWIVKIMVRILIKLLIRLVFM